MTAAHRLSRGIVVALALVLLLPSAVAAAEYRSGDRVTVAEDEELAEDLYVAAGTTVIEGTIDGDVTVAGGTVDVRGTVTGSLNVAGGNVVVSGTVGGAVRALAGNVEIRGEVGRDVVSTGGNVVIGRDATVGADLAGAGGSVQVDGAVEGDVLAAVGELVVRGTIAGDIDSEVGRLQILDGATVEGDVRYGSEREAEIDRGATIGGSVQRREPAAAGYEPVLRDNPLIAYLGGLLGLLILGSILMVVRPASVVVPGAQLAARPLPAVGAGLAAWIGQFLLLVFLAALAGVLGQFAASFGGAFFIPFIVVLLIVIALVFIAQVWTAMAIGSLFRGYAVGRPAWLLFVIGALIWSAVLALLGLFSGLLGGLAFLLGWIAGLGGLALTQLERRRAESAPEVATTA